MGTEAERQDTRKAMGYDLIGLIESQPDKTYTAEEVKQLIKDYLKTANEK